MSTDIIAPVLAMDTTNWSWVVGQLQRDPLNLRYNLDNVKLTEFFHKTLSALGTHMWGRCVCRSAAVHYSSIDILFICPQEKKSTLKFTLKFLWGMISGRKPKDKSDKNSRNIQTKWRYDIDIIAELKHWTMHLCTGSPHLPIDQ